MIPNLLALGGTSSLRVISTERFKAGSLSVSTVMPVNERTACLAPLLLSVLRRGTEKYPTLSEINRRLDYLWGTAFSIRSFYCGNCMVLGFNADLLDPAYLPAGEENLTDAVLELMTQILLHPVRDADGLLSARYVESEKELQRDSIRAAKNNPRSYAAERCKNLLLEGEPGGISLYGTEEQTMAVTREELTEFWRDWIGHLRIDCFYVGGEPAARIREKLMAAFGDRISMMGSDPLPPVCGTPRVGRGLRVEESLPVGQSQLLIALRCNVTAGHPDAPVCAVLNEMLGNSPISRLFVYVREKRSLCYSCASSYSSYYGTFLIACGLKRENRQKAEREILRQLRCMAKGEFRTEELEAAKKSLENTYRQVEDSPSALETFYYGRSLMGLHASLEERRAEFAAVTAEDVARVAGSLTADVTYFLEGTQEDGEDYDDEEN